MGRLCLLCLVASCGRLGFDAIASQDGSGTGSNYDGLPGTDATGDASHDASTDGSGPPAIAFVGSPIQHTGPKSAVDTVTFQAMHAGDALLILVACASAQQPTAVNLSAPNWAFTPLSPLTINTAGQVYAASFGALAPDTTSVTLTINWTGANCNRGQSALGDEFANIDPTGATTTFDAHAQASGAGNCTTSITLPHDNDAVWAACYAATALTGVGPGYTKSAADVVGDFAEYKLTTDPMGTMEAVSFSNPNGYVVSAVTIKPL